MASDEYRRNAIECLQLADGISDTPSRLLLIHMAQAWLRLADQAEKNLTTDVVYETPVQRLAHEQQLQPEKKDGQCSPSALFRPRAAAALMSAGKTPP